MFFAMRTMDWRARMKLLGETCLRNRRAWLINLSHDGHQKSGNECDCKKKSLRKKKWWGSTLLRIWYYGRMKAKSRPSPKSLYHCLLIYMHLLYMFQPYLGKEIHYFTRRLGRKWTSQKNPKKIKKLNSIFDINFFSRKFNKVCKQSFFLEVLCLNW